MTRSKELGESKEVRMPQGTIRYHERGRGEPIVFVHGVLVNANLWRKVVPRLAGEFRCITPDWPLGSHELAMPADADLRPQALARLIADFLAALGLERVTLVGNDTGGALCQLVVTEHPERLARLVLTSCDAYENFPPRLFQPMFAAAGLPGFIAVLAQSLKIRALRRLPIAFGWLAKRGFDADTGDSYIFPSANDAAVRHDLKNVLGGIDRRITLEAAKKFGRFDKPVLIAWAKDDRVFAPKFAERLARDFPNARLEWIADCYSFVPEDQPEPLARAIRGFIAGEAVGHGHMRSA